MDKLNVKLFNATTLKDLANAFYNGKNSLTPSTLLRTLLKDDKTDNVAKLVKEYDILDGNAAQKLLYDWAATDSNLNFKTRYDTALSLVNIDVSNDFYYQDYACEWVKLDDAMIYNFLIKLSKMFK